jgi:hypothetical protein
MKSGFGAGFDFRRTGRFLLLMNRSFPCKQTALSVLLDSFKRIRTLKAGLNFWAKMVLLKNQVRLQVWLERVCRFSLLGSRFLRLQTLTDWFV